MAFYMSTKHVIAALGSTKSSFTLLYVKECWPVLASSEKAKKDVEGKGVERTRIEGDQIWKDRQIWKWCVE